MTIFRRVRIQNLPIGAVLQAPIIDPTKGHQKLLGVGHTITPPFLSWLESRGITHVEISLSDLGLLSSLKRKIRGNKASETDEVAPTPRTAEWSDRIDELLEDINSHSVPQRRSRPSCGA